MGFFMVFGFVNNMMNTMRLNNSLAYIDSNRVSAG